MSVVGKLIVHSIRGLVFFAVLGSLIAGAGLVLDGLANTVKGTWRAIDRGHLNTEGMHSISIEAIEVADIFLLGIVMFVIALGLYQLFIDHDLKVPAWIRVNSLGDLKEHLVAVTVVLLGISFLARS